jgi:hypothetical protein
MILLPLVLLWPLVCLCHGQPWWITATSAVAYAVGYLHWFAYCLSEVRKP